MPLLYNIEKFNNTVIIQSSVSMYTDVYSVLLFSITECTTKLVSPDLGRVHDSFACPVYVYVNTQVEEARHPLHSFTKLKNTCNKNTLGKLHVIM